MGEAEAPVLSCMETSSRGASGWGVASVWGVASAGGRRRQADVGAGGKLRQGRSPPASPYCQAWGGLQTSLTLSATLEAVYSTGGPGHGQKEG